MARRPLRRCRIAMSSTTTLWRRGGRPQWGRWSTSATKRPQEKRQRRTADEVSVQEAILVVKHGAILDAKRKQVRDVDGLHADKRQALFIFGANEDFDDDGAMSAMRADNGVAGGRDGSAIGSANGVGLGTAIEPPDGRRVERGVAPSQEAEGPRRGMHGNPFGHRGSRLVKANEHNKVVAVIGRGHALGCSVGHGEGFLCVVEGREHDAVVLKGGPLHGPESRIGRLANELSGRMNKGGSPEHGEHVVACAVASTRCTVR